MIKRILRNLIIGYLVIGLLGYLFQEKMLFLNTKLDADHVFKFEHQFEELFLKTDDGETINALHFKLEKPKGIVLYFHGNRGHIQEWGEYAEAHFLKRGYDVLLMDYRSYGKSTGKITEDSFYKDAQLSYDYVKERYSEKNITVYGRSLGTGFATYVASKNNPKQLILETPYYEIADPAKYRAMLYPAQWFVKYELPSYKHIVNVKSPIHMFHGTCDWVIPTWSAENLHKTAPQGLSKLTIINNGQHSNLETKIAFTTAIDELLH